MLTKLQLLVMVVSALMVTGCVREITSNALEDIADLGPFEEFARYSTVQENLDPGKRGTYTETPKLAVVFRGGLSKSDLERIASAYMRANPRVEIDFFDSKLRLDNYVNLDSFDPRNNYKTEMTLDDDFTTKHLKARVRETDGSFAAHTDPFVPYGLGPKKSVGPQ